MPTLSNRAAGAVVIVVLATVAVVIGVLAAVVINRGTNSSSNK